MAQVVGASSVLSETAQEYAVIEKMTRVLMIVPVILVTGWFVVRQATPQNNQPKVSFVKTIPWFAVGFLGIAAFNSLQLLPVYWVETIHQIDTFLLTMAMVALGMETQLNKMKQVGSKAFVLAGILFMMLLFGGYLLAKTLTTLNGQSPNRPGLGGLMHRQSFKIETAAASLAAAFADYPDCSIKPSCPPTISVDPTALSDRPALSCLQRA